VDDHSSDDTSQIARDLGISHVVQHEINLGYGGNQKSCYNKALELHSDIVIMLHPDYQYTPRLIHSMAYMIANDVYQVVLASRILGKGALKGGMPFYKYFANRVLTLLQNILMSQKLSEYHTGYRGYSSTVLQAINYNQNSNDFVFDNQVLAQICFAGFEIGEITCPTTYSKESSSINFKRSVVYGFGVIKTSFCYFLQKNRLAKFKIFQSPTNAYQEHG
jgi:glycosyltransferase involved in cell wall biosynthesis